MELSGQTCLITGAGRGLGLAMATEFARAGARVILACRTPADAVAAVRSRVPEASLEEARVDLARLGSLRELKADILVNNAAVVSDSAEHTVTVNLLAPFLMSRLVPARMVVNVAAANHRQVPDLEAPVPEGRQETYRHTKAVLISLTMELARRTPVLANAFCPGVMATRLLDEFRGVPDDGSAASPRASALVAVDLARSGETGRYLEGGQDVPPSPAAADPEVAARLWEHWSRRAGLSA
ncbi:SDR family NAD(P)-dependent oxidoreductase [Nonomuraea soli]|uniref:NAD(P)-dependent dehydrogenase (Short-subunit alcohol dehydrogenase family) n=1 Tax=Nonomuraea soli TaxID=1032476 RepID=A0A7W0CSV8_9ACTN|nr:SDR family NAD(P)-dependent oxidoreductase [Nonomuraea soli]MBA2896564.1 NAD(P)-dependent dehydrogenase (short-subunit alcohol dehydrogenase family) [Nonomuraea soli]